MWDESGGKKTADAFSGTSWAIRCYESHPVLKLGKGMLYGGSASNPKLKTADVYVVLQSGDLHGWQSDPWEKQIRHEVFYRIPDMGIPADVPRFKKLVTWVCNQLQQGKKVHVGCIGGHGRTGTVLSAIVAELTETKDAIQWVRQHYCKKAVESKEQVAFLMQHYGVSSVAPTKGAVVRQLAAPSAEQWPVGFTAQLSQRIATAQRIVSEATPVKKPRRADAEAATKATKSYDPMASTRSLWKAKRGR